MATCEIINKLNVLYTCTSTMQANVMLFNKGIKHDFPFINIHEVPRGVLKTQGVEVFNIPEGPSEC